jgi:hypothetical protein
VVAQGSAPRWHLPLVLAVSALYESAFLRLSVNAVDEGWPLYAASQLAAGGTLYQDVFWVFPPGHVLGAVLGRLVEPPGLIGARVVYAAFSVALCGALYLLGRRLVPARWALFGALLVAVAAPRSHALQLLFGYRYLVFPVLALLAFDARLRGGGLGFMLAAGACTGLAFVFRLTPAFAVACGLAAGVLAASREPRRWLAEGGAAAAGFAAVAGPVVGWLVADVGAATLWREAVVRPVAMTALQGLPLPSLAWPGGTPGTRVAISLVFFGVVFRVVLLFYACLAVVLGLRLVRALRARRPFERPLLLAVAVFGGVFFLRTLGRSDFAHLDSALPPAILLGVVALHALARRLGLEARLGTPEAMAALLAWMLLLGSDVYGDWRGEAQLPMTSVAGRTRFVPSDPNRVIDARVAALRAWTQPGDRLLDLAVAPLFHVLTGLPGPGHADVLMPGVFLDAAEEEAFLARVMADPPAAVLMPEEPFDGRPERAIERTAPRLAAWVLAHYERRGPRRRFQVFVPRGSPEEPPGRPVRDARTPEPRAGGGS